MYRLAIFGSVVFFMLPYIPQPTLWGQETRLSPQTQAELVDRAATLVGERYVFETVGRDIQGLLRDKIAAGGYQRPQTRREFARSLTEDLRATNGDRHLKVWEIPQDQGSDAQQMDYRLHYGEPANYGITKVEILPGNVGLLRLANFSMDEMYEPACRAVDRAMAMLQAVDSVIIDLRGNPGGGARLGTYLASYFFGDEPVLLNTYRFRVREDMPCWTTSRLPGPKRPALSLRILIDNDTFSAAEGFAYQLKHHQRATIYGERSGGGSHGGSSHALGERLEVYVPFSCSEHPVTRTDFERVGVQPDIKTRPSMALEAAHRDAIRDLLKDLERNNAGDIQLRNEYEKVLGDLSVAHDATAPAVNELDGETPDAKSPDTTSAGGSDTQPDFDNLSERMSAAASAVRQAQNLPGLAIVVVRDGKTILSEGFGFADVAVRRRVDPAQTIFRIGSITKALTLLTLARQIDRGLIARDDDVQRWIDSFSRHGQIAQPLTIEHLLTHTTGLDQIGSNRQIRQWHLPLDERRRQRPSLETFLRDGNLRRIENPGHVHRYDTYGTTLAGFILSELHRTSYAQAMHQEMFDVLGMESSSVEVSDSKRSQLAVGYGFENESFQPRPYELYVTTPASSIDATAEDMAKLLQALTSDGANFYGRFLSPEMHRRVIASQFRVHPKFCGVSHGLFESWTSEDGTRDVHLRSLGHGGDMDGYRAAMTIIPSQRIGIFVATNRSPSAGGGSVDFRPLIDVVLDSVRDAPLVPAFPVAEPSNRSLEEYTGDYHYGVFCHTMSAQDQGQGAWRRGVARRVRAVGGELQIRNERYRRVEEDLFVATNGRRFVRFRRNASGHVASFCYSTSPDTFERADPSYREFPSLAQRFFELASDGELEEAIALCNDQQAQAEYYVAETEFNNAGYALMQADQMEGAVAAFRINVERFPDSWNAHDSLGEGLAAAGRTDEAISSYTRSLQLNRDNTAGRRKLRELVDKQNQE